MFALIDSLSYNKKVILFINKIFNRIKLKLKNIQFNHRRREIVQNSTPIFFSQTGWSALLIKIGVLTNLRMVKENTLRKEESYKRIILFIISIMLDPLLKEKCCTEFVISIFHL